MLLSSTAPLARAAPLIELDSSLGAEMPPEFEEEYNDYQNMFEYMAKAKESEWLERMT